MKHLSHAPREPQEVELLADPTGEWMYGGYRFAGGKIGLGDNVKAIKGWEYPRGGKHSPDLVLGTLVLATAGWTTKEIGRRLDRSPSSTDSVLQGIRRAVDVPSKFMLLPKILKEKVLSLKEYGDPEDHFEASLPELALISLRSRGVEMDVLAEACGMSVSSLSNIFHTVGQREGVPALTGCLAGGILNRKLGATSCVPLVPSERKPGAVRPIIPTVEWDELTTDPNVHSLKILFAELEVA